MRIIRRHRLDDPRVSDEVRTVLLEAATQRPSKARFHGSEEQCKKYRLATLIRLASVVRHVATTGSDGRSEDRCSQRVMTVIDPLDMHGAIQKIRRHVCEHFYMQEMRDPDLSLRTNRRANVLPRQIAMYIARQLTVASLQEIGQAFGCRHHTTVLHSITKIDRMRRSDEALNRTITRFMDAFVMRPLPVSLESCAASHATAQ
jgi:Bacterial dnaA protein helix-turn-helix